tara:strand:+ start:21860 stop:22873 length:1014 start_codon:yes stop_codon:yes gene_type:complete
MNNLFEINYENFDACVYVKIYPDVDRLYGKLGAWDHYKKFGIKEKRLFPPKKLIKLFDGNAYCKMYPDVLNTHTINNCWIHYITSGKNENRNFYFKGKKDNFMNDTISYINKNETKIYYDDIYEAKITILIRTCYRPHLFKKCIESIKNQNYSNVHILICYDNPKAIDYIKPYTDANKKYTSYYINISSTEKYKFNLYCNDLLDKVKLGYCIYLDDDNEFTHNNCLNIINHNIQQKSICIWKYLRGDKLIYPNDLNNIQLGEIDSSSFCFNQNLKTYGKWWDKQCGDYHFFSSLLKKYSNNYNKTIKEQVVFIPYILTRCIQNKIGNFGTSIIMDSD